jgi:hypothetical protein
MLSGIETFDDEEFAKPEEGERDAEDEVRRSCSNWGSVVEVY